MSDPPLGATSARYRGPRVSVPDVPPPGPEHATARARGEDRPQTRRASLLAASVAVGFVILLALLFGGTPAGPASISGNSGYSGTQGIATTPGSNGYDNSIGSPNLTPAYKTMTREQAAAVSAKVDPAVVDIDATLGHRQGRSEGTGIVVSSSGQVLTNNHVIEGATSITAQIDGEGRRYTATVVGTDPSSDIAVLQLEGASGLRTVPLHGSSYLSVGTPVAAIGNALDAPGRPKTTVGNVTALGVPLIATDPGTALCESLAAMLEIDAPVEPGNSGGPLVDSEGDVVGIVTAASVPHGSSASGPQVPVSHPAGFAIPISLATGILSEMRAGTSSSTVHLGPSPLLGVEVVGVDGRGTGTACSKSSGSGGAEVDVVEPGTPADSAGIERGDIITGFDGRPVGTPADLTRLVQDHRPGDFVTVVWTDPAGRTHRSQVELATGPAD